MNNHPEYVLLGEVANRLGRQTQYISYYLGGIGGKPNLSEGLRLIDDAGGNYHAIRIHQDDVDTLVTRINQHDNDKSARWAESMRQLGNLHREA